MPFYFHHSSLSHCYWFLTHKYLVSSIYYEAFQDVVDFFFTSSLPSTGLFFSAYTHSPLYSKMYIYIFFFAVFPAITFNWMKPNHVILWKFLVQREVTYCVGPHHTLHRLWSQNGHKLCHSGMSLMGLQFFQVNYSKVFLCFYLCTSIPHFGNSFWTL